MIGYNDAPNVPPPAPVEVEAVFLTVKVPLDAAAKQTEYDLGWEDCARFYGAEIKRLRATLQRIANGEPHGDYVRMTLDEAMARDAQDALSNVELRGGPAVSSPERPA